MSAETELERMVVRIVGDNSGYIASLTESLATTDSTMGSIGDLAAVASSEVVREMSVAANAVTELSAVPVKLATEPVAAMTQEVEKLDKTVKSATTTQVANAKATADSAKTMEQAKSRVASLTEAFLKLGAAYGAGTYIKDSEKLYKIQATAERQLKAALEVHGREVGRLSERYFKYASALQEVTTVGDESTIALMKQAVLMGLNDDQVERAAKNAIALAAVYEGSADSYIRMTAMLEQGKLGRIGMLLGMGELEETLSENGTELDRSAKMAEKVAQAQEKLGKMFKYAEAEAKAGPGQAQQLANAYGDLREQLGKVIATASKPVRAFITKELKSFVMWLQSLPDWVKTAAVTVATLSTGLGALGIVSPYVAKGFGLLVAGVKSLTLGLLASPWTWWIAGATAAYAITKKFVNSIVEGTGVAKEIARAMDGIAGTGTTFQDRLKDGAEAVKFINNEMQRTAKNSELMLGALRGDTEGSLKKSIDIEVKSDKVAFLEEELKKADKFMKYLKDSTKEAEKALSSLSLRERIGDMVGVNPVGNQKRQQIEILKAQMDAVQDRITKFNEAIKNIKLPEQDPKIVAGVNELNKSLKTQLATLGMTEAEAEVYKMKLMGATEAQLALARTLDKKIQVTQLDQEIAVFGMTEQEKQQYMLTKAREQDVAMLEVHKKKLAELAAESEKLVGIQNKGQTDVKDKVREANKAYFDQSKIVRDLEEAAKAVADRRGKLIDLEKNKANEEAMTKLKEKAQQLTEQFRTPQEAFNDRIRELNELMATGVPSVETYDRAVADAKKTFENATMGAKGLREELQAIDGAAARGAEAITRINAYRERLKPSRQMPSGAMQVAGAPQLREVREDKMAPKGPEELKSIDKTTQQIRDLLVEQARKPEVGIKKGALK